MAYTKEQYENHINNSPFLAMRKEPGQEEEYKAAFRKFTEDLYTYVCTYVYTNGKMAEFGLEFLQTAKACVSGYDRAYGDFLHYFLTSISTGIKRARAKQQVESVRNGFVISKNTDILCRRIFRYADSKGIDVHDEYIQKRVAEKFGIPLDAVQEAIQVNYATATVSNITMNGDEEEMDLFDTLVGMSDTMDESIIEEEKLTELVRVVDAFYSKCRRDVQRTVSYKLTALMIDTVEGDDEKLQAVCAQASFYVDEVFATFKLKRKTPTDRQMADMLGISAVSFSRSVNAFLKKIQEARKNGRI